ncbi:MULTISPECIES: CaiB/BaiF CoA-transferase family protein [Sulfitobacter]|jgi:crotonobetainyl-CoA:carnitine CoA-transferase CaiB-like acyl-CoA transferase|uniref:CaiB/BaiF CoA-transferase family protein n=1 Tax=Sulfitobacter faviae TaxID=1775881 RepID=A0ABZ0UY40_9RHOB|nr:MULTISPECIES: CaiB/BaiF CoA-transferase family protein [Sulfitobacter]KZX98687.1 CoA-transferase [Sulfitobacter sp. HI0021]KZX99189.1 CoA-transferase [Sulfitobacter sp. HI0027]KZZ03534.1 CoA-transferase [Sulfitobacter sp. HI0076]MDF3382085.1 CoA transferase [Sulfitobacter sp. Ks11]MDF3385504.1 CoA transferase [Sulfitobacter sp. M85]
MTAPLAGLKVVELARVLAGPWAGQTLSDLGCEVIKVESPAGDDTRQWGPPFVTRDEDVTASYFHSTNRGKASVTVDFRTEEGQAQVKELLADADILIENFKTGGLAKYGLDYASLSAQFPKLIYCSITGFGHTGPYAHRAGYDFIIQGMSGLMSITGEPDGQPQKSGMAITDIFTGVYASTAILAAVHQRHQTGVGQHIDMALLDCAVAITGNQAMNYLTTGKAPTRMGNAHPNLTPYEVFECSDGHLIIATGNDGQYQRLCQLLGLDDMATAPEYLKNADRVANRPEMIRRLTGATRLRSRDDLLAACEAHGVPAGPINDMADVMADPQVVARGMQIELDGVPGLRSPFTFSGAELSLHRPAPKLGEDNKA